MAMVFGLVCCGLQTRLHSEMSHDPSVIIKQESCLISLMKFANPPASGVHNHHLIPRLSKNPLLNGAADFLAGSIDF